MNDRERPESRGKAEDDPEREEKSIRILVADDYPAFRSRLVSFLRGRKGFAVVGEAGTGWEVLEKIATVPVDVITLDIRMPGPRVDEVIREVRSERPSIGIVVLTMYEDESYFHSALEAGAQGYVLKKSSGNALVRAIRAVERQSCFVDPSIVRRLSHVSLPSTAPGASPDRGTLTEREAEIVRHVALGHSNEEIGRILGVRARAVRECRARIQDKCGLRTRGELVHFAIEEGLLRLDRS